MKKIILLTLALTTLLSAHAEEVLEETSCINLEIHKYSELPDMVCVTFYDKNSASIQIFNEDIELGNSEFIIDKWKAIYFGLGGRRRYYRGSKAYIEVQVDNLHIALSLSSDESGGQFKSPGVYKVKVYDEISERSINEYRKSPPARGRQPIPGGRSKV
jgi:hypothetical protein